jgi:hypothetical protein
MNRAPELGRKATTDCPSGCSTKPIRVASLPAAVVGDAWKPYVSRRYASLPGNPPRDAQTGNPFITSRQVERNVIAASRDTPDPLFRD